jgi:hypothetical protein
VPDEALERITEECWDFVKFFMNNAAAIWENGDYETRKAV